MRGLITTCCLILLFTAAAAAKIVFVTKDSIYVVDDDGIGATLLTDELNPSAPRWSPDGKQIVFKRGRDIQKAHVSMMNADGTNVQDITVPSNLKRDVHPSFSPNGKSIIFSRYEPGADKDKRHSVCVMDLESGKIKKISNLGINRPEFSPDGKYIVFTTIPTLGVAGGNVWIMEDDGADARPLLEPPPPNSPFIISRWKPRWSPDGNKILYTEDHHKLAIVDGVTHYIPHGYYYFVCDRNGKNIKKLNIRKTLRPQGHDWMDDGKAIVFSAREAVLKEPPLIENFKKLDIYKFHIASNKLTTLYVPEGNSYSLDWISDHAHAVSPKDKQLIRWGQLKAFLKESRSMVGRLLQQAVQVD